MIIPCPWSKVTLPVWPPHHLKGHRIPSKKSCWALVYTTCVEVKENNVRSWLPILKLSGNISPLCRCNYTAISRENQFSSSYVLVLDLLIICRDKRIPSNICCSALVSHLCRAVYTPTYQAGGRTSFGAHVYSCSAQAAHSPGSPTPPLKSGQKTDSFKFPHQMSRIRNWGAYWFR